MILAFRSVFACAALLAIALAALIVASLFMADGTARRMEFLGISILVGAVFVGLGVLLVGVRRHVTAIATAGQARDGAYAQLETHVRLLLVYLLAGGAFLFVALGLLAYGILERIGQGLAVFG